MENWVCPVEVDERKELISTPWLCRPLAVDWERSRRGDGERVENGGVIVVERLLLCSDSACVGWSIEEGDW